MTATFSPKSRRLASCDLFKKRQKVSETRSTFSKAMLSFINQTVFFQKIYHRISDDTLMMILSKSRLIWLVILTGLQFSAKLLQPFLKTGVTFTHFQSSGKADQLRDFLNHKQLIASLISFNNHGGPIWTSCHVHPQFVQSLGHMTFIELQHQFLSR